MSFVLLLLLLLCFVVCCGGFRTFPARLGPDCWLRVIKAGHRRAPQGTAAHRRAPQGTRRAPAGHRRAPQGTAGHRSAPQRTAGHRSAPQRTASPALAWPKWFKLPRSVCRPTCCSPLGWSLGPGLDFFFCAVRTGGRFAPLSALNGLKGWSLWASTRARSEKSVQSGSTWRSVGRTPRVACVSVFASYLLLSLSGPVTPNTFWHATRGFSDFRGTLGSGMACRLPPPLSLAVTRRRSPCVCVYPLVCADS
jgi:hypothetical protein